MNDSLGNEVAGCQLQKLEKQEESPGYGHLCVCAARPGMEDREEDKDSNGLHVPGRIPSCGCHAGALESFGLKFVLGGHLLRLPGVCC